jgi:dihydroorotate dehydrogenase
MIAGLMRLAQTGLLGLEPERAHELSLRALEAGVYPRQDAPDDPRLAQTVCGLAFANPLGMAAGYDKDARVPDALMSMGFGFVEIGTVTPRPQAGNPAPRVFRLVRERGAINRLGFNSQGQSAVHQRLAGRRDAKQSAGGVLGVNIGANRDSVDRIADYESGLRAFADCADYFTLNISSPNTPGLRDLQAPQHLAPLLERLNSVRAELASRSGRRTPLLIKLSPDIADDDLPGVIDTLMAQRVDGLVISNTTLARDGVRASVHAAQAGGLSGRPLFERSTRMLARVYLLTGGRVPLIGVGGIDSGETALAKIRAGASLVQLYTGLVYAGAGLIGEIKAHILQAMDQAGYRGLDGLCGTDAADWAVRSPDLR